MYKIYTNFFRSPHGYVGKLFFWIFAFCKDLKFDRRKWMMRAKVTAFFLLIALIQVSGASLAQKVTIRQSSISLEKVFREIRKQTGFDVVVNNTNFKISRKIKVDFVDTPLEKVLDQVVAGTTMTYEIDDKTVLIKEKSFLEKGVDRLKAIDVRGKVVDENGNSLNGANIRVKGTNKQTQTDQNGEFVLKDVAENAILEITYVGYVLKEVQAVQDIGDVRMKVETAELKMVEINKGYYTTSTQLNTGNVTRIEGESLLKQSGSDPILALQGKVAGLQITSTSGLPGRATAIRLRGQNSIGNGNDPLFIVDGVPYTSITRSYSGGAGSLSNPLNDINQNDIESIEVLKDADATSIYGSRGANGVILITTKKAKNSKTSVVFNMYAGGGEVVNKLNMLNTEQYIAMRREAFTNDGAVPSSDPNAVFPQVYAPDLAIWDPKKNTNWQDSFIGGTAQLTDAQISLSGGNEGTKFLISSNYRKETTVFPGNFYNKRFSTHFNVNHLSPNKKFSVSMQANYVVGNDMLPESDLSSKLTLVPNAPDLYNADGTLNWQNDEWTNPMAELQRKFTSKSTNLTSSLGMSYKILSNLSFSGSFGYSGYNMDEVNITPATSFSPTYLDNTLRSNQFNTSNITTWNVEPQVNYNRSIGKGKLNVLVGTTFSQSVSKLLAQTANSFSSDDLIENVASAASVTVGANTYSKYRYNSIFGRISYDFKDKYVINLTGRRDGSSRFGPKSRFGNFGAVGAAWIFSKENFFQRIPFISFGKIRASYGSTGNDQFGDYQFLSTYSVYPASYQGLTGLEPTNLPNPYFEWETVKQFEIGTELSFFKNRFSINASFYRKRTDNQLVRVPLPALAGKTFITGNLPATIENRGFEIELTSSNISRTEFTWNTNFNLNIPKNRLVAFPNIQTTTYATTYSIGQSLSARKRYHFTGIDPTSGSYVIEDVDKNGSLTTAGDYMSTKDLAPKIFGGMTNTLAFKGIEVIFTIQFVKQQRENYLATYGVAGQYFDASGNMPDYVLDRWQKAGDVTGTAKFTQSFSSPVSNIYFNNILSSDGIISDASFVRFKTIHLSYSLPKSILRKINTQSFKFYLQGQNLFTITKYKGLDPETRSSLPPIKMFTAGMQITL
jgi:TonB-linked SusC/RagA family outer membrane protein